jgi:hypothetical protein
MAEATKLAAQMNITVAELLGGAKLPKTTIAQKYVYGQPLIDDEKLRQMLTNLRNFHAWNLRAPKREKIMLVAKVGPEHYFREEMIHIEILDFLRI